MTMTDAPRTERADGRVVAIAGPVIDVEFPPAQLPELNHAVEFDVEIEGRTQTILAEVAQQLGHGRVRAVCMKPTDGLTRGTTVRNTGHGIMIHQGTWHDFPLCVKEPVTVLTANSPEVVEALASSHR